MTRLEDARGDCLQQAAPGRATLWDAHSRLLNRYNYLEEQLHLARQRLGVKQSELRAAHFRACEDRKNRECYECRRWRDVDLAPCFHLVCRGCSRRHTPCPSPYISTGLVEEGSSSACASSLLNEISREVRTLQEGSRLTMSIWGQEYLVQDTHRLKEHCEWLEQQLAHIRWEYEKVIFVLNSAHTKATLDRRNRPCEGCSRMFREVYLAPCFHLVCQACYPGPKDVYKACHHGPAPPANGRHTFASRLVDDFRSTA